MAVQNPPSDGDASIAQPTDFHWAIPKISTAEKYFLSQLITSPSKDVRKLLLVTSLFYLDVLGGPKQNKSHIFTLIMFMALNVSEKQRYFDIFKNKSILSISVNHYD